MKETREVITFYEVTDGQETRGRYFGRDEAEKWARLYNKELPTDDPDYIPMTVSERKAVLLPEED